MYVFYSFRSLAPQLTLPLVNMNLNLLTSFLALCFMAMATALPQNIPTEDAHNPIPGKKPSIRPCYAHEGCRGRRSG